MERFQPRRVFVRAAGALLLLGLFATAVTAQDRVVLTNGKDKSVRIKTEDIEGVWYTATGGTATTVIRWDEITSIEYSGAEAYQAAVDAYAAGKLAEAVTQLEALAADKELKPVLLQNVLYYLGIAKQQTGKNDEALTRYKELLAAFPKSRYLVPVGTQLLNLHLAKDDVAAAARDLEPILGVAKELGKNEGAQAALGVLHGRLLEEQKKFDDAETQYGNVAKTAGADPNVVVAAKLGLARCAQKRERGSDAEKLYRDLIKADAPSTILAGAWNGLGDMALAKATAARDPDGLRVALFSYLRGVVMYLPGRGDPTEELERALAGASRAFKAIGELEDNADRKRQFLDRARQRRDQLASQFPSSRFLKTL